MKKPAPPRARLPTPITDFFAGLTESSWGALTVAGVVFSLTALWSAHQLERFVADYPQLLAADNRDDYAFVTSATIEIASTELENNVVAIVGASCLRPAIDEAMIAIELQKSSKSEHVFNLTTAGQSLWESIAIADYIVPSIDGIVIIDTNPLRFSRAHDFLQERFRVPRLGFRSTILKELASDANIQVSNTTGVYAWDFRAYFGPRLGNVFPNLINGPVMHNHARLTKNVSKKQLDRMSKGIMNEIEGYDQGVEILLDALSELVVRLAEKNSTRIVLIEPPINPHFVNNTLGTDFYNRHLTRLREFAQQHEIQFWELSSKISPAENNFADWCHLNNLQARETYSQLLATYLVDELRDTNL